MKMPAHVWVRKQDGTMKLVAKDDLMKAMDGLKDHSNGYQPPKPQDVVRPGLGTAVANVLSAVGIKKTAGCRCGKRQVAWDRATPDWVRNGLSALGLLSAGGQPDHHVQDQGKRQDRQAPLEQQDA